MKPKTLKGTKAVKKVKELYNLSSIPLEMELIILDEGFCEEPYKCDKGVLTKGVGQTGIYFDMPFPSVYSIFVDKARALTKGFDSLPTKLRAEIVSSTYRGDWQLSKKTRELFNKGLWKEAAKEFLNNKEYKERVLKSSKDGVVKRMERFANLMSSYEV